MRGVALCALLAIGCGGRVLESESDASPDAAKTVDSTPTPSTDASGPIGEDVRMPTPIDVGPAPTDVGPPPTSLAECFGDMGKSNPSTLKDLLYDWETCTAADGSCHSSFRFNVGCNMELRRGDVSAIRGATANDDDCTLLRRWSTSERLLGALDPSSAAAKACAAAPEPPMLYEATVVGGTPYALKTFFCPVEPFVTHRRCLQRVMEKYFPPK